MYDHERSATANGLVIDENAVRVHESFQDSGNPGYFLIKVALWLMALAVIGQALVDMFRPVKADGR